MEKILITYATTPLGLRTVKLLSSSFAIEKSTSDEIPSVLAHTYHAIPKGKNPTYAHEVLKLALDSSCQYVLPLGTDEIHALAETAVLFEEYGIRILCPSKELLSSVRYLAEPKNDIPLYLINDRQDMLSGEVFEDAVWDGLCIVSDSKDDFILAVV